jgi:uncharacterized protein
MLFAITHTDKPDSQALRASTREAHLAYLACVAANIRLAGPVLNDAGQPTGSLLIVEAPDRAAAEAFAVADPYTRSGLFARTTIQPYREVFADGARVG